MIRAFAHTLRPMRLRASVLALFAVFAGAACDNTEPLATDASSDPPAAAPTEDSVTTTDSLASLTGRGLPFGSYRLLVEDATPAPLSLNFEMNSPSTIVKRIDYARQRGTRMVLQMTGGPHTRDNRGCCLSVINGVLQFDRQKWNAKMATFNTRTIREAVAKGVADGTVIGASVMDEPNVCSSTGGNTWGPCGTMTKARVDELCAVVQRIFPTLPAGVTHQILAFQPTRSYRVCQFIMGGVKTKDGTRAQYVAGRDAALAMARRDRHAILFNLNVLAGGNRDTDGTWNCTGAGQGGKGPFKPLCRMTASQVRERGLILGPAGCGLMMWTYNDTFWGRTDNREAFKDVAAKMATATRRPCRRS
jgi:hypothetical protein